jgi:hypothetical protein
MTVHYSARANMPSERQALWRTPYSFISEKNTCFVKGISPGFFRRDKREVPKGSNRF